MKLLCLSCVSATFELDNKDIYYSKEKYDVFLDDKKVLSDVKTNVFSLYNLSPNTNYVVKVNNRVFSFLTPKVSEIISSDGIDNTGESNVTKDLQALIDNCNQHNLKKINNEDKLVAYAVEEALPQIEKVVEKVYEAFLKNGRLIYIGAGTSGRIGILDAVECPPTYGVDYNMVQCLMADGEKAFNKAIEDTKDSFTQSKVD